jgi:hypothetical protein
MPMTPDQEYDYYAQPDNQEPQGGAARRRPLEPAQQFSAGPIRTTLAGTR